MARYWRIILKAFLSPTFEIKMIVLWKRRSILITSLMVDSCESQFETYRFVHLKMRFIESVLQPIDRGGVKLEFVRNLLDLIRKFAIRLIRKGKKYSKNSMKINLKFVRFDSNCRVESNWNSFEIRSIWFENLRFDWFERAKNIRKIRWKLIRNSFDSIQLQL